MKLGRILPFLLPELTTAEIGHTFSPEAKEHQAFALEDDREECAVEKKQARQKSAPRQVLALIQQATSA